LKLNELNPATIVYLALLVLSIATLVWHPSWPGLVPPLAFVFALITLAKRRAVRA
jgi:hypothetical protein